MGRRSKLSDQQWAEAKRMALEGKSPKQIADHFGVARSTIVEGISDSVSKIRSTAAQVVTAEQALTSLPISDRLLTMDLASRLRSISSSLAMAAEKGAQTAHRLHHLANEQVAKVDDAEPLSGESISSLKNVGILTKLGNDSAQIALNLLAANKATVEKLNDPTNPDPDAPPTSGVLVVPGLAESSAAWSANSRGAKA